MLIGSFQQREDGSLIGQIKTVFFEVAKVVVEPVARTSPTSPDARLFTGDDIEFGAAWKRTAKSSGRPYYSVQIDDITFAAPQWARLVQGEEGQWSLLWHRTLSPTNVDD